MHKSELQLSANQIVWLNLSGFILGEKFEKEVSRFDKFFSDFDLCH